MRIIYNLMAFIVCGGACAFSASAQSDDQGVGYHLKDLIFNYKGQCVGSLEGTEKVGDAEYDVFQFSKTTTYPGVKSALLRFDGKRVYEWIADPSSVGLGDYTAAVEVLLYDFALQAGDEWQGMIFQDMNPEGSSVKRTVVESRQVILFGEMKNVQRMVPTENVDDWIGTPYHNAVCNYLNQNTCEFVQIEDIGAVNLPGTYPFPVYLEFPTMSQTPFEISELEKVSSRDGKYSYTLADLGVSAGNQVMRTANTWEYYSETADYEAVHQMEFGGVAERDGKLYGRFYTKSVIILDKATGNVTELENDDPDSRCVLMRENLGQVFVRGLEDSEETLLYDFMLQQGDEFSAGADGKTLTVADMPVEYKDFFPGSVWSHREAVKTYSFEGMTESMGVTEYTGVWGANAGSIVNPAFVGGNFGGVEWPWAPASDCTLASQWEMQSAMDEPVRVNIYSNPEYAVKADELRAKLDHSITPALAADAATESWYTLQGVRVAQPHRGELLIRVSGGKAEKVRY